MAQRYDVVVVGGGHAGVEAAWMACALGAETALVTMQPEAIGRMSCNPAIGGLGKGHMVREIDALGGLMGLATDSAGIQFRMLNRSKGPAVWAPRAQADRNGYPKAVQSLLAEARGLTIIEGSVERIGVREERSKLEDRRSKEVQASPFDLRSSHFVLPPPPTRGDATAAPSTSRRAEPALQSARSQVESVELRDGRVLKARAVILTTGTFLRGLMHRGPEQTEGGRIGEASAVGLSASLAELGFTLGRLKTGTPPRLHRDSIDYDVCERQPGDDVPMPFSFLTDGITQRQIDCWVTWTNRDVHEPIRANLHRAPMYSGQIQSTGPRYCPSIEDKVVRFADKDRHQIFLEPEGYDDERVYCNGISTSLPQDVQDDFVHRVPGLRNARILQYGYAVEYDFVPTHQTKSTLETKLVDGLFLAGQINGTSGYEEAAGQGVVAGINAVQLLRGGDPFVPGRDEAYIGVMIDDLITRPPSEPYRMFTSRAEYRLLLRADNADRRLTPLGRAIGTVDDRRWTRYQAKCQAFDTIEGLADLGRFDGLPLRTWMRRPESHVAPFADAIARLTDRTFCAEVLQQALVNAKYSGYVDRQAKQVERFRRLESLPIPEATDFGSIRELRAEARQQLVRVTPRTLGQAGRLSGVSPADLTVLWLYLSGRRAAPVKV